MSCNRLYGGQKKNKQQSKQASQRKRSGGEVKGEIPDGETTDGEIPDGETTDSSSTVNNVVDSIGGVVGKVAADSTAAAAASTGENQNETVPTGATEPAAPPAQESKSWFSNVSKVFGFGSKGGKRRTQRKQQKQRRTQKAGSQKAVIGRLYSKTCVHCVAMEGAWKQLQKMIKQRGGNILMKNVEAGKMEQQLPQINKQFLGGSDQRIELQGGFPTLFKVKNSKVEYYGGERTADAMFNWALQ